jgi:hypothetical protein
VDSVGWAGLSVVVRFVGGEARQIPYPSRFSGCGRCIWCRRILPGVSYESRAQKIPEDKKHDYELQGFSYRVIALRCSIQHRNTRWPAGSNTSIGLARMAGRRSIGAMSHLARWMFNERVRQRGGGVYALMARSGIGRGNSVHHRPRSGAGLRRKQREGSAPRTLFFWPYGLQCWRNSDKWKACSRSTWRTSCVLTWASILHPNWP